ncbi:MAG: putative sensor domain DACNV-containing protein [Planctomycetota bacterium]|jgi:hypothetical protein
MSEKDLEALRARLAASSGSGIFRPSVGPKELVDRLYAEAVAGQEGISPEIAFQLIDVAYNVSLMTDEARHLRFTVYLPPPSLGVSDRLLLVPFQEFRFKAKALRTLAAAIPPYPYVMVVYPVDGKLYCCGVSRSGSGTAGEAALWDGLYVTIHGPGHISVLDGRASRLHLELRDGMIETRPDIWESGAFNAVCVNAARRLAEGEATAPDRPDVGDLAEVLRRLFGATLATTLDFLHGGVFLVVPQQQATALEATTVKYPARGPDLGTAGLTYARTPSDDPNKGIVSEQAFSRARALAHLSAVDGCVLLDDGLRTLGFGTIMRFGDMPDCRRVGKYETITGRRATNRDHPRFDVANRGTRHQSAAWFCAAHPGARAFVISQDGELHAFEHAGENTVWAFGPLGAHAGTGGGY